LRISEYRFLSRIFGSQKVVVTGEWMNSIMVGFIIFILLYYYYVNEIIECMASKRNTYKILFAKSEDNRTFWRPFISLDVVKMPPFED